MKKIIQILFIYIMLGPSSAFALSKAYWGYVSPGPGLGFLGHGFLVIKKISEPFLMGDAFQYNLKGNVSASNPDAIQFSKVRTWKQGVQEFDTLVEASDLVLSKQKFYEILAGYSDIDDRIVRLYELNLTDIEVNKLLKLLHDDLQNPKFSYEHIFGAEDNCVSRPIKLLNEVVTPERRIAFYGNNEDPFPLNSKSKDPVKLLSDPFLNRTPFYIAQTLEHHPISRGLVKYYENESIQKAKFMSGTFSDVHQMSALCHWNEDTEKTVQLFFSLFIKSEKTFSLESIIHLSHSCPASRHYLVGALAGLYQAVDVQDTARKSLIYQAESELLR